MNGQGTLPASPRQFASIQVLRGFAALGVVLLHVVQMLEQYTAGDGPLCRLGVLLHTGAAGVDLFFVISGFVMVQSTKHLFQRHGSSKRFLIRRAIRIVPMYWIATLIMLLLVLLPFTLRGEHFSLGYTLRSLLFIPTSNPASGADLPLLPQGWTLWYEVYFYLIFAVSLRLPARWALPALVLFLTASSVVGAVLTPTHPLLRVVTSQLLLEFSLGCLLAYQVNRIRLSSRVAFALLVSGILLLSAASLIENAEHFRLLFWGIPVTLIVAGSVFLEQETPVRFPGFLTLMGDSSYSTYLLHVFVVIAGATLLKHGYFTAPFVADLLALTVVVGALVIGYVAYFLLERNLQRYLKAKVSGF